MESRRLKTKDLKLARVKYYDWKQDGVELTQIEAYAFLEKFGDYYVNVFDLDDKLPVFERSIYPNVTKDGEEYGNRLIHVSGAIENGPCFVIEPVDVQRLIGMDSISYNGLKEYVYHSDKFFVDRVFMMQEETPLRRIGFHKKIRSDRKKLDALREYMSSHEVPKQYVK